MCSGEEELAEAAGALGFGSRCWGLWGLGLRGLGRRGFKDWVSGGLGLRELGSIWASDFDGSGYSGTALG